MRKSLPLVCLLLVLGLSSALAAAAAEPAAAEPAGGPQTEDEKTLYALGLAIAQNFAQFDLTLEELTVVQEGIADGVLGREPKVDLAEYGPKLQPFAQRRMASAAVEERKAAEAFVAEQAAQEGAVQTESGLVYSEITPGDGDSPAATDTVTVHYHGTLRDGTVFDSSVGRGQPATFPLNRVIGCWTEALQRMKVGGKSRIVCPPDLAYGDRAAGGIPPGAALMFEVELLNIQPPAAEEGAGVSDS